MARNYEKNFGRLNRLWLEKETGRKEKRPKLNTLKTYEEISYWIPSIKNDLDVLLKQTEVPCYTDRKIDECRKHIRYLEIEYKAFVRKLHQLNPEIKAIPWTPRPYERKTCDKPALSLHPIGAGTQLDHISPLHTPVLMHDALYQDEEAEKEYEESVSNSQGINQAPLFPNERVSSTQDPQETDLHEIIVLEEPLINSASDISLGKSSHGSEEVKKQNPLGLDYSSSEDES